MNIISFRYRKFYLVLEDNFSFTTPMSLPVIMSLRYCQCCVLCRIVNISLAYAVIIVCVVPKLDYILRHVKLLIIYNCISIALNDSFTLLWLLLLLIIISICRIINDICISNLFY